jgi:hypothetical protein
LGEKQGCQGNCKARLEGVGLAVNCSSYTWPFDLNPSTEQPYDAADDPAVVNCTNVLQSHFEWEVASGNMSLNIQYKDKSPCQGELIVRNCTIQTALVAYPVILESNNLIALDPTTTIFDDIVSHKLNINYDVAEFGPMTLGGSTWH